MNGFIISEKIFESEKGDGIKIPTREVSLDFLWMKNKFIHIGKRECREFGVQMGPAWYSWWAEDRTLPFSQ